MQIKFFIMLLCAFAAIFPAFAEDMEIEHSFEQTGERNYCTDAAGEPLNGKIYDTWPNGEYRTIINYKKGYADGLATYFNEDGKLMERVYYKTGIKNGMDKIYYANRSIKVWANYKDGKLDGWQNFFTPQGRQRGKMYYKNGKLTEGYCISYAQKRRVKNKLTAEQILQNEDNKLFFCMEEQ